MLQKCGFLVGFSGHYVTVGRGVLRQYTHKMFNECGFLSGFSGTYVKVTRNVLRQYTSLSECSKNVGLCCTLVGSM